MKAKKEEEEQNLYFNQRAKEVPRSFLARYLLIRYLEGMSLVWMAALH
jgi:hypothetical protein